MFKNGLAIILSSIFILIIVMPTVIVVLDDSTDVSIFYNTSEEEKDKSQEKNIDKEFVSFLVKASIKITDKDFKESSLHYYLKSYQKPHIELSFPPPKMFSVS
jgi:hypothetical protein